MRAATLASQSSIWGSILAQLWASSSVAILEHMERFGETGFHIAFAAAGVVCSPASQCTSGAAERTLPGIGVKGGPHGRATSND